MSVKSLVKHPLSKLLLMAKSTVSLCSVAKMQHIQLIHQTASVTRALYLPASCPSEHPEMIACSQSAIDGHDVLGAALHSIRVSSISLHTVSKAGVCVQKNNLLFPVSSSRTPTHVFFSTPHVKSYKSSNTWLSATQFPLQHCR